MKRRRIHLAVGLLLATVCLFVVWPRGPEEPVFQGKGLTFWIGEAIIAPSPETEEQARRAIKAVGPSALPYFLHQFTLHESPLAKKLRQIWGSVIKNPILRYNPTHDPIYVAQRGIVWMSPDAAPALPTLAGYLCDTQDYRNVYAVCAMGGGGEAALPYLMRVIASTNPILRAPGASALQEIAKTSEAAIPPLLQVLEASLDYDRGGPQRQRTNDFDSSLPRPIHLPSAVACLYGVKARPDLTVPALTNVLFHPDDRVRLQAVYALGSVGELATSAVPSLLQLMSSSESWMARKISNAVFAIDPTKLPGPP